MMIAGYNWGVQEIANLPLIAGHVALDFVNTAEDRGGPEDGDSLLAPADLRTWGERCGLISRSAVSRNDERAELRDARDARELLFRIFLARIAGEPPSRDDLSSLTELGIDAFGAARLELSEDGGIAWIWDPTDLATIRHVVVTRAIELLGDEPAPRLKQCSGEHCDWLFLDTTKRGNRRWCSMSECGQEAKNRRRRSVRRASAARRPRSGR